MGWWSRVKSALTGKGSPLPARISKGDLVAVPRPVMARLVKAAMRRSVAPQDVARGKAGKPQRASQFSARDAIKGGLEASVYAYRCATILGLGVGSVPLEVRRRSRTPEGEQWTPEPEHPLQTEVLAQPNERDGWSDFALRTTYLLCFGGDCYWTKIRSRALGIANANPDLRGAGVPIDLWPWGPDKWSPIAGGPGESFVTGYRSNIAGIADRSAHDVVHLMRPALSDEYHGVGEYRVAKRDIDTDLAAALHQESSLENQGVPSGVLRYKEAEGLTEEEWGEVVEHFLAEYFGAKNARRPMALGNEIEWIQMAMSMLELDYVESRRLTREAICIAMGVSPVVCGILDRATYSNYSQALEATWDLAIIPLLLKIVQALNDGVASEYGADVRIFPQMRNVDALFGKHERRMQLATALHKDGALPWSALNESYQLGLQAWPSWDVPESRFRLAVEMQAAGVPWSELDRRLGLGLQAWPGWELSFRPASSVPADTFLVEGDDRL